MPLPLEIEEGGTLKLATNIAARAIGRVGSLEYQYLHILMPDGEIDDVIRRGEFACAYETTCALHNLGLLSAVHTTVDGFQAEVETSPDWIKIDVPITGAIGILERKKHVDGTLGTRHTFTCISRRQAVHNDAREEVRTPQRINIADFMHHTGEARRVEACYIHKRVQAELS
jgi:hypothetical protein